MQLQIWGSIQRVKLCIGSDKPIRILVRGASLKAVVRTEEVQVIHIIQVDYVKGVFLDGVLWSV